MRAQHRHPRGRNALRLPVYEQRGALPQPDASAGPRNAYASCGEMSEAKRAMSPISAAIPNASTQPIPGAAEHRGMPGVRTRRRADDAHRADHRRRRARACLPPIYRRAIDPAVGHRRDRLAPRTAEAPASPSGSLPSSPAAALRYERHSTVRTQLLPHTDAGAIGRRSMTAARPWRSRAGSGSRLPQSPYCSGPYFRQCAAGLPKAILSDSLTEQRKPRGGPRRRVSEDRRRVRVSAHGNRQEVRPDG